MVDAILSIRRNEQVAMFDVCIVDKYLIFISIILSNTFYRMSDHGFEIKYMFEFLRTSIVSLDRNKKIKHTLTKLKCKEIQSHVLIPLKAITYVKLKDQ